MASSSGERLFVLRYAPVAVFAAAPQITRIEAIIPLA